MYIFYPDKKQRGSTLLHRILRIMKLIIMLLTAGIVHVSATTHAQQVTLNLKNATLSQVFREIRKQTNYDFVYNDEVLRNAGPVTIQVKEKNVREALSQILDKQQLAFTISDNSIVIQFARKHVSPVPQPQQLSVTGIVVDETETPIAGVVVRIQNDPQHTTATDKNGEFVLSIPTKEVTIQFSNIGYETVALAATAVKSGFRLKLTPKLNNLDQIQVTAFGTTSKRLNAGNITTITAKDIEKHPVNNVLEALQGKVAGLFIQQTTGQPGGAFSVRMRNSANFSTGAAQPLVIIDGVRYPSGTLPLSTNTLYGTQNFLQGGSGLNYINPNDIERIDVLKDIDATAIYGSSGAYGVILITTKKTKSITPTFNANMYTGVSVVGKLAPILNTQEYLMLRREALSNDNLEAGVQDKDVNGTWPEDRFTDWRKELIGNAAATTNANISYSGGAQNTTYMISGSFRDMGNIQLHKGNNRDGSLRFALNTSNPSNTFDLTLSGTYMGSNNDMVPFDFSQVAASSAPNAPSPFLPDGSLNWDELELNNQGENTIANINRRYNNLTNNLLANLTLVYRPTKNITLNTILGFNDLGGRETIGYPSTVFHPDTDPSTLLMASILNQFNTRSLTVSPYGEYRRAIAGKGDLSVKIGGEINRNQRMSTGITGRGFSSDALLGNPSLGASITTNNTLNEYRSIGLYGIVKFVWDNKYIVDINTRRDGSIKFGPGRRFGNFGSAAIGWIFTEEKLFKDNLPWFSYGKLRASSGTVGGDAIDPFLYLSTYSAINGSYDGKTGFIPNSLPNPLLEWERNFNSEVALELAFFKNRLTTDISYYHNRSSNQLLSQPLSSVTGYASYVLNSDALIRNTGLEIAASAAIVTTKDFSWSSRFNISLPESKILRLPTQSNPASNYVLGKPVTGVLTYRYAGVNPETGMHNFTNTKGETAEFTSGLTQADKTEFIDLAPTYFGGFQNTLTYKRISLDFAINFTKRMGQSLLGQSGTPVGYYGANGSTLWLDRWQKAGDITDVPKVSTQLTNVLSHWTFQSSDGAYEDATYARLQNVSLRYAINPERLKKIKMKQLSVYFQGQNLLTVSKYAGLDPENLNANVLPPMRIFTAGINMTF